MPRPQRRLVAATLAVFAALQCAGGSVAAQSGFVDHSYNSRDPVRRNNVVSFRLPRGECSPAEYQRREMSDCYHGNGRSQIKSRRKAELGDAVRYSFDIRVPELGFSGGPNRRSLLSVADWRRDRTSQNNLYKMHLDTRRGLTFGGTTCVPPARLDEWTEVEVVIRWSRRNGFLQVTCGGERVIRQVGINTAIPADCAAEFTYQCDPRLQKPGRPVEWRLGLLHQGYGEMDFRRGLSPAGRILREPVRVDTRDVSMQAVRIE